MLHEAVCFINHGGQNSICDGLLYGVPQIVVPGKVFERRYNAKSLTDNNAGILLEFYDFNADHLRAAAEIAINNPSMKENAIALGKKLASSGGINYLADCILTPVQ
jgi:UDP:flavonoid glycosyltransferase YjiC (YdhE family)